MMVSCLKPIYHPCPSRVWKEREARKSFLQKAQSAATTIGGLVWALKPFSPFPLDTTQLMAAVMTGVCIGVQPNRFPTWHTWGVVGGQV